MNFKSIIKYFALSLFILILVFQTIILGLPLILEAVIKTNLPQAGQGFDPEFSIEKIGLTRTLIRNIQLGKDFDADLVELIYELGGSKIFRIKKIIVSGISLHLRRDESGKIRFNSMVLPMENSDSQKTVDAPEIPDRLLPFIPDQAVLKNFNLYVETPGQKIHLPIEVLAKLSPGQGRADVQAVLTPFGQDLSLNLSGNLNSGLTSLSLRAKEFNPGCLTPMLSEAGIDLGLSGPVDFDLVKDNTQDWQLTLAGLEINREGLPELTIKSLTASLAELNNGLTLKGGLVLTGPGISESAWTFGSRFEPNTTQPLTFDLEIKGQAGNGNGLMSINTSQVRGISPVELVLTNPQVIFSISGTTVRQTGQLTMTAKEFMASINGNQDKDQVKTDIKTQKISLTTKFNGSLLDEKIHINLDGALTGMQLADGATKTAVQKTKVSGDFQWGDAEGHLLVSAKGIQSIQKGHSSDTISANAMTIDAKIKDGKSSPKINFKSLVSSIKLSSGKKHIWANTAGLSGLINLDKDFNPVARLRANVQNAGLMLGEEKVSGSNIEIDLPFSYPFRKNTREGSISAALEYDKQIQAQFQGMLSQASARTLILKGQVSSPNLEPLKLDLDLKAGMDEFPWAEIHFQSHRFSLTQAHLKQVMPDLALPGNASIDMSFDTWISLRDNIVDTHANIIIHDGSLDFPDLDLTARGITGAIAFNNLLIPETLPGQELFIHQMDAGQFSFNNAGIRFSIEDGKSLNIENLKFNWCNGLVSTESVRLPAKDNKLSLTLYCDRLEMASLLKQIGAFDAEGGGSLNGRIPVTYANGDISFDNGFLFSTPGQGGRVFVKDLDRMMTGFPRDTREFNQLDMAGEALKDFEYKWAKLQMNTKGDTLEVQMELDGKPAKIMPFEYRTDINSFVRVKAGSPGSNFQGVKLDVNLKLPFNRVMKFGNKLNDILN